MARRNTTAETIAQKVIPVGRERKKDLLAHLIQSQDWHQVLVFTRMKHGANRLTEYLNKVGITAMAIHGNKSQGARTKALAEFKSGELAVLVATDIAARGIDIDQLPHVINFELPNVPEDYVHRIGRTGRAGAQGEALSLVCVDEEGFLADIEKLIKRSIPREVVKGFEPDPSERPEPILLGRRTLNGSANRGGARPGGSGRKDGGPRPGTSPQGGRPARPQSAGPSGSHAGGRPAASGSAGPKGPQTQAPKAGAAPKPQRPGGPPSGSGGQSNGAQGRSANAGQRPAQGQNSGRGQGTSQGRGQGQRSSTAALTRPGSGSRSN